MQVLTRLLRWLGFAIGAVIAALLIGFGLLQTPLGKDWLAGTIAGVVGASDFRVSIEGLRGLVPFRTTVGRIEIADEDGTYLTMRDIGLDISAAALLSGRVQIRSLSIGEAEMARPSTSKSTLGLRDYLRLVRLPLSVALDGLSIGRLALAPPVLGESIALTVTGYATTTKDGARASLDLHRIDGKAGSLALALAVTGVEPVLSLDLTASEPSGILADRLLGRSDRLPLGLALKGKGPVADWHGRLTASAGPLIGLNADVTLAVAAETAIGLSGTIAAAPLLPAEFRPAVGDRIAFSAHATLGDKIVVDRLSIDAAAATLTADGAIVGENISANVQTQLPDLARLAGLLGAASRGKVTLTAKVGGTMDRPVLDAHLSGTGIGVYGSGAGRAVADISVKPAGDAPAPIAITAHGRIEQLAMPEGVALPPGLGHDIDWSLAATAASGMVDVAGLSVHGAGIDLAGSGHFGAGGQELAGRLTLAIADLRPFSGIAGQPIAGAVKLAADIERQGASGFAATLDGAGTGLRTGIAAVDALLGGSAAVKGEIGRDAAGRLVAHRFAVSGEAVSLSGSGEFDPTAQRLSATLGLDLPRLAALGQALGAETGGALKARIELNGAIDRLQATGRIEGSDIAAGAARIDRLLLDARIADLSQRKGTLDGSFRAAGLDGTLALVAETSGSELIVPRIRLAAGGGAVEGSLRVALDTGLARGSIAGRIPNLAAWSRLAGTPLGGNIEFDIGLDARQGQTLDLTLSGTQLAASGISIGRLQAQARLADLIGLPTGSGSISLGSVSGVAGRFDRLNLAFESLRPGRFGFRSDGAGQPLAFTLAGDAGIEPGGFGLRLDRLAGTLGPERFRLEQPLTLARRGADLSLGGLALRFGAGRIAGNASVRGDALSLSLNASGVQIPPVAKLLGHSGAHGALGFTVAVGGNFAAPRGRLTLNAHGLGFTAAKHGPGLGLTLTGNWNGREIALDGRVTGLRGDSMSLTGSVPLLLSRSPLGISVPPQGRLALRVQGAGQLDHFADLLPLGEDRLTGRYAVDITVGGTVAAPDAGGRMSLSDARYENFASGAVLTGLRAEIVGNRDRLTLTSLSAGDGNSGRLEVHGAVALAGASGPSADLSGTLTNFRIAATDEATATASGRLSVVGPLSAPKVGAQLAIDRVDINLPQRLPPSVVTLRVVEINSRTGKRPAPPPAAGAPPALPAALDITLDMPGRVFVRGHGLDSEWRGRLRIAGTTAAPVITGSLEPVRGNFDLLGKSFRLTRGAIVFDGGAKLDPALDITAEVSAADITAQVVVGGLLSAPSVTLTSTPVLPQDEILSRVLFGRGVGRITAAEGIQLAQAAAALTGGGPDLLGRLRTGLGLDWLRFGSATAGTSAFNRPTRGGTATGGNALTAGKYIAEGVSVGVTQGVSPPTSKVTVEIQLTPRLTLGTEAGQNSGTGVSLNYNYDY